MSQKRLTKLDQLLSVGSIMSNFCFNVHQRRGQVIDGATAAAGESLYKRWDRVRREAQPEIEYAERMAAIDFDPIAMGM